MYVPGIADPILCTARPHAAIRMIGDLKGTSFDFSERVEDTPVIVFDLEQFIPENNASFLASGLTDYTEALRRGSVVRFTDLEGGIPLALKIDTRDPVHGITVNCKVVFLAPEQLAPYAQPEHTQWPPNIS